MFRSSALCSRLYGLVLAIAEGMKARSEATSRASRLRPNHGSLYVTAGAGAAFRNVIGGGDEDLHETRLIEQNPIGW